MQQQKIFIKRFVKSPKVEFVKVDKMVITSSKVVLEGDKYEGLAKRGKLQEIESRIAYIDIPENDADMLAILKSIDVDGEEAAIKKYGEETVDGAYAFAEAEEEREQEAATVAAEALAAKEKEQSEIREFIEKEGQEAAIAKYGQELVTAAIAPKEDNQDEKLQGAEGDASVNSSIPPSPNPINPPPTVPGHHGKKDGKKEEKKPSLMKRIVNKVKNRKGKK